MNKQTNNFRKCSFCPHHKIEKPCCCQVRTKAQSLKSKNRSKGKNKHIGKQIMNPNQSTISYINSTLPITNSSVLPHLSTNIIAQNSILRTENDYLKRQLHSQYNNVSAFMMKDDRNISTLPTSENQTSRTYQLHDKLYASNRHLQQALLQLDELSKSNKELHQINTRLELEKEHLRVNNQELSQEIQRLKKKLKKMNKLVQNQINEAQIHRMINENSQLDKQNKMLRLEMQQIRNQLRRKNSRTVVQIQNLSPEWVAHTSTKINAIERNICKLEQEKENNPMNQSSILYKERSKSLEEDPMQIRKQLIVAIRFLKVQSQVFRFESSALDEIMNNPNSSIMVLIKNLCQCMLQPVQLAYYELKKDVDRKLRQYECKFQRVAQRMENMIIKIQNNQLKKRGRTKTNF